MGHSHKLPKSLLLLRRPRSGHWEQGSTIVPSDLHARSSHHFGGEQQSNKWGMELGPVFLWVPSESFIKPERSHRVEGTGSLDAGETVS